MELAAEDVLVGHGGGQLRAVFCRGNHVGVAVGGVVGVDEVDTIAILNAGEQGAVLGEMQGIPADVGDFLVRRDDALHGHHLAGNQAQALVFAVFIALFKQHLHA